MPYTLQPAQNVMKIEEQQFGSGQEIRFTKFTSCIGVIAREGNKVTGVHLVIISKDDTPFNNDAAQLTINTLGKYTQVVVIGQIDFWKGSVGEAYDALIKGLKKPIIISTDDGIYGGRVNEQGTFQTYQNGRYVNV